MGFVVGITRDFVGEGGQLAYRDIGLELLEGAPGVEYRFFDEHRAVVGADQIAGFDAVIALTPQWTADSLAGAEGLGLIARFGVGFDTVDVAACTAADVLLTITMGAVNHSVAEATITWMLALSHKVMAKDRLVRSGRWDERSEYMGSELRQKTLGIVGLGGIGGRLVELVQSFGMGQILAFDPFASAERAEQLGVGLVDLPTLMQRADFLSINCPLTEQTKGLVGREELALMQPTAYLINTARGGIVDEAALIEVLAAGGIAGAGIDVYADEPVAEGHPLAALDNVLLAPHAIAWTDELFSEIGHMTCQQALALSRGEIPPGAVNPEVTERAGFKAKLARWGE